MEKNVGTIDMIIRIILGAIVVAIGIYYQSWWGLLGILPLATAGMNYCPVYSLFKINTKK